METDDKPIIYYLDDTIEGKRDLAMQLISLFATEFSICELPLKNVIEEYLGYLADLNVAGVFIDQNLDETGEITGYTGVKLTTYLRAIYRELPLYLVTGHPIEGELESEAAGDADSVVAKGDLITDSPKSLKFRRQFLRRVNQYERALAETQHRFRSLLAKKVGAGLSSEESEEYALLRLSRELPTDVAEECSTIAVVEQLNKINGLLQKVDDLKKKEAD